MRRPRAAVPTRSHASRSPGGRVNQGAVVLVEHHLPECLPLRRSYAKLALSICGSSERFTKECDPPPKGTWAVLPKRHLCNSALLRQGTQASNSGSLCLHRTAWASRRKPTAGLSRVTSGEMTAPSQYGSWKATPSTAPLEAPHHRWARASVSGNEDVCRLWT